MSLVNKVIEKFDQLGILPHTLPNAIGMWENEQECLAWSALNCPDGNFLEIGGFCGGSAAILAIAQNIKGPTNKHITFSVDNNFNRIFDINIYKRGYLTNVTKLETDSLELNLNLDSPLSLLFIDGFHSYSRVIKEFNHYKDKLCVGAHVLFHDTSPFLYKQRPVWNHEELLNNKEENFYIDEAIYQILDNNKNYELFDIPIRKDIKHFQETRLDKWVRATTSPFYALGVIIKKYEA